MLAAWQVAFGATVLIEEKGSVLASERFLELIDGIVRQDGGGNRDRDSVVFGGPENAEGGGAIQGAAETGNE